ncbi:hypothetical protein IMSAG025_01334 [Muribaculaceae bacterium]|nr:hypothetical protein IMSAGC005_03085 [Lachnospiraceae bacterium]GFI57892.1 hypothetical protein IMSAG025_01334 [Muribaculaceae bacterium]
MSRRKELFLVTVINVMFAIYTRIFMGSMLYISLIEIGGITYSAMIGWFLYVCSLCVVLLWERRELYCWKKICLLSAGTSVVMVMMRAVFDYISDQFIWSIWSMYKILCLSGILSDIFGIFLTVALFLLFVKGKKKWTERVKKPFLWIIADALLYAAALLGIYSEIDRMTRLIETTEENITKIDYFYAYGFVLPINVWTYTFFMIMLWWLMRTLYVGDNTEGTAGNAVS